jgi:hypothetical protein
MLAAQCRHALRVPYGSRIGKLPLDFAGALDGSGETVAKTQLLPVVAAEVAAAGFAYFWRKRSTRPAVSTSFCFPVKNGWHCAQISVWISAWVDRVW